MTKPVYDALDDYSKFKMRNREGKKTEGHTHKSYKEIMELLDSFNKDNEDVDNQFEDPITSDMPLQDLEGGMEDNDLGVGDGTEVRAKDVEDPIEMQLQDGEGVVENQTENLITSDMQLQDLGGGMDEGDLRVLDGPEVEAVDDV